MKSKMFFANGALVAALGLASSMGLAASAAKGTAFTRTPSQRVPGNESFVPDARDHERNRRCSERTVRGTYAFALTGNVQGVGPIAASGTTTFDGQGDFSITGTVNSTTSDPALEGTFAGTYTVNPDDCTASATVTTPGVFGYSELRFRAVIIDDGREIRYLITNPGVVFAGATVRQ